MFQIVRKGPVKESRCPGKPAPQVWNRESLHLAHDVVQGIVPFIIAFQVKTVQVDVVPCHVHCRMTEQGLKLHHPAARKNEILCEGVPEQMTACFCDTP